MKVFFSILMLLTGLVTFAQQKQGNQMRFGQFSGLDLNTNPPTPTRSQIGSPIFPNPLDTTKPMILDQEGTATWSDKNGKLQGYSDGIRVWNCDDKLMPNGTGLNGGISSTQAALAVPLPGSDNLVYLFTTGQFMDSMPVFSVHIIDMCLDSGRGDIISKNKLLMSPSTEKVAACEDADGKGYWILAHKLYSDSFYVWHLTSMGLGQAIIYRVGSYHGLDHYDGRAQGQMKISPFGSFVSVVVGQEGGTLELFRFNNSTGKIYSPITVKTPLHSYPYGTEFSPDENNVFLTENGGYPEDLGLYRYSLKVFTKTAIDASRIRVANLWIGMGLQATPNGEIYVASNLDASKLHIIKNPNSMGDIDLRLNTVQLLGTTNFTFPSFVAGFKYHNGVPNCGGPQTSGTGGYVAPRIYPNPVTSGHLTIDCSGEWTGRFIDGIGRVMKVSGNGTTSIDLNVANGLYFLEIYNKHTFTTFKVIVAH